MKKYLFIFIVFALQACSQQAPTAAKNIVTVTTSSTTNPLYYAGVVQPLKTVVIPSPADGVVVEMPFQYGEAVKAGQLLYMISSTKFLNDYKTALMQYVKAKSDFNNGQMQLTEGEFLHKNQLISDDDFKMKQGNFYASQLALLQARDALENLLQQLDIKDINLNKLTIADIDKIKQAMHLKTNSQNLRILAPTAGIVLAPSKGEEENKKINKGDVVKQGDVLAILGDMQGLSVQVKVNELVVNQLKVGQKVKITGIAFAEDTLDGVIKRVDRQGEVSAGGLPTFLVEVVVPKLTVNQQQAIHVGMSAKVEIDMMEAQQMLVPIKALQEFHGESVVQAYDVGTHKTTQVAVKTGRTTLDSVAILSGLKEGDKIVIPN